MSFLSGVVVVLGLVWVSGLVGDLTVVSPPLFLSGVGPSCWPVPGLVVSGLCSSSGLTWVFWSVPVPGLTPAPNWSCWSGVVVPGLVWVSGLASVPWSGLVGGLTVVSPALFSSGLPVCWPVPAFWSVPGVPGFSWPSGLVWPAFSPGVGVTVLSVPFSPGLVLSGAPWPCWSVPGLVSVPWPGWVLFSGAGVTVVPAPAWLFWSGVVPGWGVVVPVWVPPWPCCSVLPGVWSGVVPGLVPASCPGAPVPFWSGVVASGLVWVSGLASVPWSGAVGGLTVVSPALFWSGVPVCWPVPAFWSVSGAPGFSWFSWPFGLVWPAFSPGVGVTVVPAPFSPGLVFSGVPVPVAPWPCWSLPGLVSVPWAGVPVCWPVVAFWSAPGVPWPCWPALWAGVTEASAWLFWGVPAFCSAWLPAGVVPASGQVHQYLAHY